MKRLKLLSIVLVGVLICVVIPLNAFAAGSSTITVVLLGNNGTAKVAPGFSESKGITWGAELVNGNMVGTDTIQHINEGPFNDTNLKAGYTVTANEGYYIDGFFRSKEDYENGINSLDNLDLSDNELYLFDEHGFLIKGVLTGITWPNETFYISFAKISEKISTLSLVVLGNHGAVTNEVGEYSTSLGIEWDPELFDGDLLGEDTLLLEHKAPWGDVLDGVKAGYKVVANEGYFVKAIYTNQDDYENKRSFEEENYFDVEKTVGGYIASCKLAWFSGPDEIVYFEFEKIQVPVTGVTMNKSTATLNVAKSLQLNINVSPANATNKGIQWTSSNTKVASVSKTGKVIAKAPGNVIITATSISGGMKATCKIKVLQPVESVKLNKKTITLGKGKKYNLKANIYPLNASNNKVKWTSSNPKIASVSSKGAVKGVKKGIAFVNVVTVDGSGKRAKCKVVVK